MALMSSFLSALVRSKTPKYMIAAAKIAKSSAKAVFICIPDTSGVIGAFCGKKPMKPESGAAPIKFAAN